MQFDIVIAHFKEDIRWLENLNHDSIRHIIVYNKDEELLINNNKIINFNLNNVGREAHTYLTYCVEFYHKLPDFVIFLQGYPHNGIDCEQIKNWIDTINQNPVNFTNNSRLGNMDWFLQNGRIFEWGGQTNQSLYDVKEWAKVYVRDNLIEENYPIFWNACFGVSKKAILSNHIEKYQRIINEELMLANPEAAHYLERLWYYLFNLDLIKEENNFLNKTIWMYWGQGWENVGLLQKIVAGSWMLNNPKWKIELLNDQTLRDHLLEETPYLFDSNKNISYQARSDIIRLALLNKYGGVWADATMLCMQPLDHWAFEAVEKTGIWMYHGWGGNFDPNVGIASWFILSYKNNYVIKKWKERCDQYWKEHNEAHTYFWMDELFRELYDTDSKFREAWSNTPNICCEDYGQAHCLVGKINVDDNDLKEHFKVRPPYALKFWSNWNEMFPDLKTEECKKSIGYYAFIMSKRSFKYKHPFK
jgi:hypothetical protein